MKHTPEPWGHDDPDNKHMITAGKDKAGRFIYVCDPSYARNPKEEAANSRLIIAAPALKKALKKASVGFCNYQCSWDEDNTKRKVHCEECREVRKILRQS